MHSQRLVGWIFSPSKMKSILISLILMGQIATICAEPVWHCSRNESNSDAVASITSSADHFSIASVSASEEVINLSLNDLIDIYSGVPVRISGLTLSACFMLGNEELTSQALLSLGLQPSAIQALARKSAIIQSNLFPVTNETQMLSCIATHFPAVGYLQEAKMTQKVQPCF